MSILFFCVLAASLAMLLGSFIFIKLNEKYPQTITWLTSLSAGFLIVLIFFGIIPEATEALEDCSPWVMPLCVALGAFFIVIFEKCLPVKHHHNLSSEESHHHDHQHLFYITLIAFGMHSFFELLSIFITGAADLKMGLILALVIGIHNIPIGFIIMAQLEGSGESRQHILKGIALLAFIETAAAGLAYLAMSSFITPIVQGGLLAVTGGIMIYLLFDELLPKIYHDVDQHSANYAILIGIVTMLLFLILLGE